ncbi:restriction endonuclease subunit S [Bacillus thuringiensis]|nr:restriction endonuclease subunit S [Bacillus thuringiensis]MED2754845.1 restriction endonuclease subunit S [Bacillus thuringiensis]MED2769117.1 restriction endonuclease subunit S [Bacillus thuringiensis]MED2772798.1 restriction endonuclease subunit S [Bacillus thuringiensis]MED2779928.1 restriction endonuclease subunit S [Bacillus thuringiensis]
MEFEVIPFERLFSIPLKNGLSKPKKVRGEGYPMVNMGEIFAHDRIRDIEMDLVPMNEREMATSYLQKNDLLFARQSLTLEGAGKCSIFLGESTETTYESHLIRVRLDNNKCNPLFYYYYFKSPMGKWNIGNIVEQVAAAGIRGSDLKKLKIPYLPYEFQNKIAKTLNYIDEKIELNQKLVSNLEQLAQTLFKHWFINFEFPNEQGQPYKSNGGEMVESELGEIPKGWSVQSLDEVANYQNGLAMQKYRPQTDEEEFLPVLKIRELNRGFTDVNSDKCSINIKDSVKIYDGDVIFSWSGTLLVKLWTGGRAGLNQHLFKVTSDEFSKWFYYLWTKHHLRVFQARAAEKATTMGHIKRAHLQEAKVLTPSHNMFDEANKTFKPIINQIITLGIENKKLEELRDTLLLKLLSGEIEIPDELVVD